MSKNEVLTGGDGSPPVDMDLPIPEPVPCAGVALLGLMIVSVNVKDQEKDKVRTGSRQPRGSGQTDISSNQDWEGF